MSKNPFEEGKIINVGFADLMKSKNVKEEIFGQREPSDFFNYVRDNWDIKEKEENTSNIKYLTLEEVLELWKEFLNDEQIRKILVSIEYNNQKVLNNTCNK